MAKIAVFGTGYVGLVTSLGLAELGHQVVGVDVVADKVQRLNQCDPILYEDQLEELLQRNIREQRVVFTLDAGEALRDAEAAFICVGTPSLPDGQANLSYVEEAFRTVLRHAGGRLLVVVKSTVPVGTNRNLQELLKPLPVPHPVELASNPEFLREGRAVYDFMHPDRIVIGANGDWAAGLLKEIYSGLNANVLVTDPTTSELIKYASNCFLATKISFINWIADICEAVGADVTDVGRGMGLDPRIGPSFLGAGLGYGGSCFPKDIKELISRSESLGVSASLLKSVDDINQSRVQWVIRHLEDELGDLQGRQVAVLGLAFKPFTDDIREAAALRLIRLLTERGARVRTCDPKAMDNARTQLSSVEQVTYCEGAIQAATRADATVLVTEWPEYVGIDLVELRSVMKRPLLLDGRNAWKPGEVRAAGFTYYSIGRIRPERPDA